MILQSTLNQAPILLEFFVTSMLFYSHPKVISASSSLNATTVYVYKNEQFVSTVLRDPSAVYERCNKTKAHYTVEAKETLSGFKFA